MWRRGLLQLTLGNLYWQQTRYAEAQKAYTEAIGLMDKVHPEYETANDRSKILDELVPHVTAIQLQDSLQHLAGMTEEERMAVVEGIIAQVIAQEEKERKAAQEAEREERRMQMLETANDQSVVSSATTRPGKATLTKPYSPPWEESKPGTSTTRNWWNRAKRNSNVYGDDGNWKTTGGGETRRSSHWTILKR